MNLKEFLQKTLKKGIFSKYTLLIEHYGLIEGEKLERNYYTDTPIYDEYSGISKEAQEKYIVLIPFYKPIDIGRNWTYWDLNCIIVTTKEELLKHYSPTQLENWLEWLDNEVRKEVRSK